MSLCCMNDELFFYLLPTSSHFFCLVLKSFLCNANISPRFLYLCCFIQHRLRWEIKGLRGTNAWLWEGPACLEGDADSFFVFHLLSLKKTGQCLNCHRTNRTIYEADLIYFWQFHHHLTVNSFHFTLRHRDILFGCCWKRGERNLGIWARRLPEGAIPNHETALPIFVPKPALWVMMVKNIDQLTKLFYIRQPM